MPSALANNADFMELMSAMKQDPALAAAVGGNAPASTPGPLAETSKS